MKSEPMIKEITFSADLKNRPTHHHDCYQIIYIKEGSAEVQVSDGCIIADAGCFVFVNNLEKHKITIKSERYLRYTINISPTAAVREITGPALIAAFTDRPKGFLPIFRPADRADAGAIVEIIHKRFGEGDELLLAHLLNSLLFVIYNDCKSNFTKEFSATEQIIYDIKRRIIENPKHTPVLTLLAKEYHISPYHLAHSFSAVTGCGLMRFLTLQRLAVAREMLKNTDISITALSESLGFSDLNSFCRRFKKEVGCTPSQYRQRK